MAKGTVPASESAKERGASARGGKKARAAKEPSPELLPDGGDDDADGEPAADEEDGEFEVEAVLDYREDMFEGGPGYLVSWAGYPEESNSWIEAEGAGCDDLIKQFWKARGQSGPPARGRGASARKRSKAADADDDNDASASASAPPKRGGRKSAARDAGSPMDEDTKPAPTPKKRGAAASAAGAGTKRRKQENGGYDIQREDYDDMSKYMHQKTWEDLVQAIDTVEHDSDGLSVYFQITNGQKMKQPSDVCRKKFPQKLLDFYESNLKWRAGD